MADIIKLAAVMMRKIPDGEVKPSSVNCRIVATKTAIMTMAYIELIICATITWPQQGENSDKCNKVQLLRYFYLFIFT